MQISSVIETVFFLCISCMKEGDALGKATGIRNYRQRVKELKELNLTSDLLSSVVFEDTAAIQDVLRILTGICDLKILRVEPQRSLRNLYGRSSILDIWAEDSRGNQYNMEIQIAENEDHLKRSRFIQSRIDSRSLGSGMGYDELPDLYLIFVTEKDFLNVRTGITRIVRIIKGTDRQIENGVHEIYANLEYPAEDEEVTRLLQFIGDTNNPEISRDGFQNLSERVEYLKNETGGARGMCELMEREWNNGREEGRKEGELFRLIDQVVKKRDRNITVEVIADALEEEEVMIQRILLAASEAGSDKVEEIFACL